MSKDILNIFVDEFARAGGKHFSVRGREEAYAKVSELRSSYDSKIIALAFLSEEEKKAITDQMEGVKVIDAETLGEGFKEKLDAAELGITGCNMAIARTGSLVLVARKETERLVSCLPAKHIALVRRSCIVENLHSTLPLFKSLEREGNYAVSIITGPSRTGDIMGRLVRGAHGPGEVIAIIVEGE